MILRKISNYDYKDFHCKCDCDIRGICHLYISNLISIEKQNENDYCVILHPTKMFSFVCCI